MAQKVCYVNANNQRLHEPAVVSGWQQGEDHLGSCQGDCREHAAHIDCGVGIRAAAFRLVGAVLQGSVSTDNDGMTRVTAGQQYRDSCEQAG